ncbi:hypothetical protein [Ruegeria sp. R14_0]|uniref:hypothetical protein n=1 Tax=Ruegeria sp. R14_0 TaxID=2821100 RepID=UPI001ADC3FF2|nr:hypothetical protein [Ruegeria sp. R14_0]MBO9445717.1 hypothetical protein [Ruegeria sp. R14_0]
MGASHVIVAIVTLCAGLVIGRMRKPKDTESTFGNQLAPTLQLDADHSENKKSDMSPGMRLFYSVFLTGWLIAWSAGILMAVSTFSAVDGGASLFVVGWLIVAVAGWVWAVYTLWKLLTGGPVNLRRRT